MAVRRSILAPGAVLLTAVVSGGWFLQRGVDEEQNVYRQIRLLEDVVDYVSTRYVDEVDRAGLYDSAIDGMLRDLGDPNTAFLRAEDYENLRIRTEGEYGGVGLEITERNGRVTVVTPLPGTPGTRAGIRAGDQIVEVEGESAEEWTTEETVTRLRGKPGTDVTIRVVRPGVEEPISFTLTRAVIELLSVPFYTEVAPGIGYVPLQVVSETSSREIREAIEGLAQQDLRGLILDLRGNPGGLLDQGVAVSDLFLEPGDPVVETRGRAPGQNQTIAARSSQPFPDLPVVVLVDERSASAAEIIAGALQDHDRALVVGAASYGKGSVQTLYQMGGGNVLKLTTARWFTPSGRSIQMEPEDREERAHRTTLALDGSPVERHGPEDRPEFLTFGGRVVYGGGGITPDVTVVPDTLTTAEGEAVRTLYRSGGAFYTALFNYAVAYVRQNPDVEPGLRIGEREMTAFFETLADQGIEVDREVFDRAGRFIRYHLGREIALQSGGEEAQFRQIAHDDLQLERALQLLVRADTPGALFTAAGSRYRDRAGSEVAAVPPPVAPAPTGDPTRSGAR